MAVFQTVGIVLALILADSVAHESTTIPLTTTTTITPSTTFWITTPSTTVRNTTLSTTIRTTIPSATNATTTPAPTTTFGIASPTLGNVSQGETTLTIEWSGLIRSFYMVRHAVTGQNISNSLPNRTMDTAVTITNLTPGQSYDIQIIAYRTETGGEGIPGSVNTSTTRPSKPTDVQGEAFGRAVKMTWNYTEGHIVEHFTLSCIPTIGDCREENPLIVGNSTDRELTILNTTFGITYEFRLKAVSNSITSTEVNIEVTPDGPRDLRVSSQLGESVTLSWTDSQEDVNYYRVYWNAMEAGASASYLNTVGNMNSTTITTLEPGYSYQLFVVSINVTGYTSASSNLIKYTAIPDQVTGLKLQYKTNISLTFTWNFTGRYDEFDFDLSPGDNRDQGTLIRNNSVYTLTYGNLLVDTEYTFKVRTKVEDAANSSGYKYSEYTTAVGRTDEPDPEKVSNLREVNSTDSSVFIAWDPPEQKHVSVIGYVVQLSYNYKSGCSQGVFLNCTDCQRRDHSYSEAIKELMNCTATMYEEFMIGHPLIYQFQDLSPYTTYTLAVYAINTQEPSLNEITVTTSDGLPGPVKNIQIAPSSHTLSVSWESPLSLNGIIQLYNIRVSRTGNLVADRYTEDTSITLTEAILPYTNYTVSVRAKTNFPDWGPAATAPTRTLQAAPTGSPSNFQSFAKNSTSIELTWGEILQEQRNGIIRGYILWYKETTDSNSGKQVNISGSQKVLIVNNLSPNTLYTFALRGYVIENEERLEGVNATTNGMTKEGAPTASPIDFTSLSKTSQLVELTWSEIPVGDRTGEIVGYILKVKQMTTVVTTINLPADVTHYKVWVPEADTEYEFRLSGYAVIDDMTYEGPSAVISIRSAEKQFSGTTNEWSSAAFALISVVAVLICLLAVLFVKYQRIKRTDGNKYDGAFNPQTVSEYDEVSDALELRPRMQSQVYMTAIDNCKRADPTYETPQAIPDGHTYDVVNMS